jgi:hypothetical protein
MGTVLKRKSGFGSLPITKCTLLILSFRHDIETGLRSKGITLLADKIVYPVVLFA